LSATLGFALNIIVSNVSSTGGNSISSEIFGVEVALVWTLLLVGAVAFVVEVVVTAVVVVEVVLVLVIVDLLTALVQLNEVTNRASAKIITDHLKLKGDLFPIFPLLDLKTSSFLFIVNTGATVRAIIVYFSNWYNNNRNQE
jgi:hypothetical protein